jgi:hypothetical protein
VFEDFTSSPTLPRQGGGSEFRVLESLDRQVGSAPQVEYWQMTLCPRAQVKCVFRPFVLVTLIWANK